MSFAVEEPRFPEAFGRAEGLGQVFQDKLISSLQGSVIVIGSQSPCSFSFLIALRSVHGLLV